MKRRTAWMLVAAVAAVALGAAAVGALALLLRSQGGGSAWSSGSYLYLGLEGEIPENPAPDLGSIFGGRPTPLRTIVESLDRAAADPDVKGVMLRVGSLTTSWGRVQEIRDAILRFRESGRPAYAHVEFCGNREYYLASACSKVYAVPTGILNVSGLAAEITFFRNTLDKLGIEAQFEAVGKYKNSPNQFTEAGLTEPHREQMEALLDGLFEQYLTGIASGRSKTEDEVRELLDRGLFDASQALEAGLVDELLYRDQVEDQLNGAQRLSPRRYVGKSSRLGIFGGPKVALIYAVGDIMPGESQNGVVSGASVAGADTISRALRQARRNSSIKAIVVRVDSPGGSGTASDVIWREIGLAREAKPVVVSMGDVAASGGYYIAMGSSAIVAQPGTITGSIGVYGGKFSLKGLYDKLGVSKAILTRGKHADMFSEYRAWNEDERRRFRGIQEAFYEDFVKKVADGRGKTYEQVHEVAQGRIWTGEEALRLGLVDRLGGLDAALAVAKEKAGIAADEETQWVVLPEPKGWFGTFLERDDDTLMSELPPDLRLVMRWAQVLSREPPLLRLPFEISVR